MILKKNYIGLLIIPQLIFIQYISKFPDLIEKYYSLGIYQYLSGFTRSLFSVFSFSFGDIIYLSVFIYLIIRLFKKVIIKQFSLALFFNYLIYYASIIHFVFYLQWGLNYYRTPIQEKLTIKSTYTIEDLKEISKELIIKSNKLHREIAISDSSSTEIPYSIKEIKKIASLGYNNLTFIKDNYPEIKLNNLTVKKSILSLPLTYFGFSGYINPFTNESQINSLMPKNNIPHTASHEIAHQLGFAQESECNFIAFLNTKNNEDIYFKYSGYTFALRQCLNELYKYDRPSYNSLLKLINKGILNDYNNSSKFWEKYSNPIESITKSGYDNFLKFNKVKGGIDSYNKSVSLIINYYKNNKN